MDDSSGFGNFGSGGLWDGRYVTHLARRCERMSRSLGDFRKVHGLSEGEALTFLAVGSFNIRPHESGLALFVPIPIKDLARSAGIEISDIRRNYLKLRHKGLVSSSRRGLVVIDVPAWQELAETLL